MIETITDLLYNITIPYHPVPDDVWCCGAACLASFGLFALMAGTIYKVSKARNKMDDLTAKVRRGDLTREQAREIMSTDEDITFATSFYDMNNRK